MDVYDDKTSSHSAELINGESDSAGRRRRAVNGYEDFQDRHPLNPDKTRAFLDSQPSHRRIALKYTKPMRGKVSPPGSIPRGCIISKIGVGSRSRAAHGPAMIVAPSFGDASQRVVQSRHRLLIWRKRYGHQIDLSMEILRFDMDQRGRTHRLLTFEHNTETPYLRKGTSPTIWF